jgi:hypothetical protein
VYRDLPPVALVHRNLPPVALVHRNLPPVALVHRDRRQPESRGHENECHEAGGLPPGARLLVLTKSVSEGGRLSWCTSGWT